MTERWVIPGRIASEETEWTVIARAQDGWVFVAPHNKEDGAHVFFKRRGKRFSSEKGTGVPLCVPMTQALNYALTHHYTSVIAPLGLDFFRAVPVRDLSRYGLES